VSATRAARCRASPGDRASSPRGADHAVSGSPDPATGLASGVFPMADSRQPARGSRTGGASGSLAFASTVMALGSPRPSRSLHRVDSSAFSGSRVPRPRVLLSCSTIPTRAGLVYVVIVPTGLLDCSVGLLRWIAPVDCSSGLLQVHLARRSPRSPVVLALLARRTMSPSSFQRSPLHCVASRGVHVPRARRRAHFGDRSPTRLVRRLRGLDHPGGLLLPDPARVLHRDSSHGVRDVSSPRQRIPTTHSCPSKPCSLRTADRCRIAPPRGRAPSPFQVTLVGSP
jgi:hypothetical protein